MDASFIIAQLSANHDVFKELLLSGVSVGMIRWKSGPEKWCLLEIACHLADEEVEDFRTRVSCTLENPVRTPPPIDPEGWVTSRKYLSQDFEETVNRLLEERRRSVEWLKTLEDPDWDNHWEHPKLGPMSAGFFLSNWLAHDYLHMRQIIALKFAYLQATSGLPTDYAGSW